MGVVLFVFSYFREILGFSLERDHDQALSNAVAVQYIELSF
jgi:hypothetical protein